MDSGNVIVASHPNTQATSMSVDVSGELAVLGSKRHLTLINLYQPKKVVRRINLNNKWDISHIKWNPSSSHKDYFLTTYNQCADIWQCSETKESCVATLAGHTRAVSDVDWSRTNSNLMATCSLDTYIYLWDIRDTKKQKLAIRTISGASQVKWNKFDENCIATAHDGNIRIWDIRNGKSPTQYITAHVSKINYLDWSPHDKHELSSAGQDATIRFWDTAVLPRSAKFQINVRYPVWRAEYTPFGTGMASIAFLNFRETPLTLWNVTDTNQPVHIYDGHKDVVLDFQWIRVGEDRDWQLVTWSKDQVLQLWRVHYGLLLACGDIENDGQFDSEAIVYRDKMNLNFREESRKTNPVKPPSSLSSAETTLSSQTSDGLKMSFDNSPNNLALPIDGSLLGSSPNSVAKDRASLGYAHRLSQEFQLLNVSLPNFKMEQVDIAKRMCIASLQSPTQYLKVHITFPPNYPQNAAPIFKFIKQSKTINQDMREKLLKTLCDTAQHHVRSNTSCLEPCLRQLTAQFSNMTYNNLNDPEADSQKTQAPPVSDYTWRFSSSDKYSIPFPRTSGARFCSAGYLVLFKRPTYVKGFLSSTGKTPRSFSSLLSHRNSAPSLQIGLARHPSTPFVNKSSLFGTSPSSVPAEPLLSSYYYYKEKRSSRKSLKHHYNPTPKEDDSLTPSSSCDIKQSRLHQSVGHVGIFDVTRILPISKQLSTQYIIPSQDNFQKACLHNKAKAQEEDMDDLVQLWSCVSLLPKPNENKICNEFVRPFSCTPMGRPFLSKLMSHYSELRDVQTLAMLSCTFGSDYQSSKPEPSVKPRSFVKRSFSYSNFEQADTTFTPHKAESKFLDNSALSLFYSVIARSPTNAETKCFTIRKTPEPSLEDYHFVESSPSKPYPTDQDSWDKSCQMFEPGIRSQLDAFKYAYCDVLGRWKMDVQIAEVRKHSSYHCSPSELVYVAPCQFCDERARKICQKPSHSVMICIVCQLPCKTLSTFCSKCYHGGHVEHMRAWFKSHDACPSPTNCDCRCV